MMERRRIALQLTPLLDLLLIVIFAQHMEVIQDAQSAQQKVAAERMEIESEKDRLLQDHQQQKLRLESEYAELKSATEVTRKEYDLRFQSILDQQQKAGSALADALQLPGELIEQLSRLRADGQEADAARLQSASQRLRQILKSRGTEFLEFMVRFDEMQKHVSVWEVHLQANGKVLFTDGEQTHMVSFETESDFSSRLFEASKSFSAPRTLVLVLLTYGDAQAGVRRTATEGMPRLITLLRQDAANTRWFDFSLMGFRPQGPIFNQKSPASDAAP